MIHENVHVFVQITCLLHITPFTKHVFHRVTHRHHLDLADVQLFYTSRHPSSPTVALGAERRYAHRIAQQTQRHRRLEKVGARMHAVLENAHRLAVIAEGLQSLKTLRVGMQTLCQKKWNPVQTQHLFGGERFAVLRDHGVVTRNHEEEHDSTCGTARS